MDENFYNLPRTDKVKKEEESLPPSDFNENFSTAASQNFTQSEPEKINEHREAVNGDSLYLQQLQYTPEAEKTFLYFFVKNFRVIVLLVLSVLVWGLVSFNLLPLESNPEVKIPYGIVTVALPGASPADVEELVVKKIEAKVSNLSGVKQIRSTALNSFAATTVEFRAEEDLKDALRRLRDAVDNVRGELPAEAGDPTVSEVSFSNTPVWTIVVTGPYDNFTLRKYAEMVEEELKKLPGTSDVTVNGGDVPEISVVIDPEKLQLYGISMDQIQTAVRLNNFSLPLGTMNIGNFEYTLRSESKLANAKMLRQLGISTFNGQIVRLEDVAVVSEKAQKRDNYSLFSTGGKAPENAVTLNVIKKTGSSIIDLIDNGKKKIAELKKSKLPENVTVETTLDYSEQIRTDFSHLQRDGLITILLVTIVLFLFVGLKEAFVAGLAVPLVFCATFGLMLIFGITLNFLSIFSLILALGLLVDDAIVVVQATKQYLKTGKFTPEEAVLLVFRDYKILLTTTTLTTIWAFIPLVLATGIIGQFIRSIPITVSVTLAASFFIAIIVNHPMAIILERFRVTKSFFKGLLAVITLLFIGMLVMTLQNGVPVFVGLPLLLLLGIIIFSLLFWYRNSLKETLIRNETLVLEELADSRKIKEKIHHHYLAEEKSLWLKSINGLIKLEKLLPYYGHALRSFLESKTKSVLLLVIVFIVFIGAVFLPASGILKSEFLPPSDSEYMPGPCERKLLKLLPRWSTCYSRNRLLKAFPKSLALPA